MPSDIRAASSESGPVQVRPWLEVKLMHSFRVGNSISGLPVPYYQYFSIHIRQQAKADSSPL
jgi:hypothetical protein